MLLIAFLAIPAAPVPTPRPSLPNLSVDCAALVLQMCQGTHNSTANVTDSQAEPSRSPMTRVCFSFAILLLGGHNVIVTAIPELRTLYGPYLLIALYSHVAVHLTLLIGCLLPVESVVCTLSSIITQYVVLCAACWLLVTSFHLWHNIYLVGRGLWVIEVYDSRQYAKNSAFALLSPVVPVGMGILFHLCYPLKRMDPEYGKQSCGLGSDVDYVSILFIPLYGVYVVQTLMLLSTLKMHHSNIHERQSLARSKHHQARFSMVTKMMATNWFVWTAAFLSTYLSISILWHLFALFCALQVIFVTITFVFTRPVMEVFLKILDSTKKAEDPLNNGSATLPMLATLDTRTSLVDAAQVT